MKVWEIVAWHHDATSLGLYATEELAARDARRLADEGKLMPPLASIVERDVIEE